ncbi:hypothetical protein SNOG_07458 [Parastagonospora nodorum SN15]|uniref:Heterokaryon incompatibility domain-containing protein n=1 Tax=Phaeosphaeria nodorum (strain SN15 / ATCC MYA-4574 / FGSC 10173) TaxID=321614 RepID=Q0ULA6_PHANO|nr:hypothetical protein SNOG_07458 [Parastagonospora nodorum SN15]EAT84924.2 hypothetical protein SNOG_07458 [Parastagonospora nodorum SN15]
MITENGEFNENDWWWIDSLCINLTDGNEREQQVRIMADIYKRAKRAVIWLGEEKEPGSDCTGAIGFLHKLASLQVAFSGDDRAMRESLDDPDFISNYPGGLACGLYKSSFYQRKPSYTAVRKA